MHAFQGRTTHIWAHLSWNEISTYGTVWDCECFDFIDYHLPIIIQCTVIDKVLGSLFSNVGTFPWWWFSILIWTFLKKGRLTLTFLSARSKVVWLRKSGRTATLVLNHNNRFCLSLRHVGHFYCGNDYLLCKLLRVCKHGGGKKKKKKLADWVRTVCSCPRITLEFTS